MITGGLAAHGVGSGQGRGPGASPAGAGRTPPRDPCGAYRRSTAGAEPGSGRPADSDMRHTAKPPITAAAIM